MKREKLLNTVFDNGTMQDVLERIAELVPEKRAAAVVEINVDVVMKMEKDDELRCMVELSDLSLIDGKPLVWISKMRGKTAKEKISGSDLMPAVLAMAQEKGFSVMILGGREEVAKKAEENIRRDYPHLRFLGAHSPTFGFEKNAAECEKIDAMLREKQPDILFLCLGCPKQEKWWLAHRNNIRAGVCLCAGASVDFIAGSVKRAPKWVSNLGFEWFYRFLMEPGRLFKRYFVDDMQIIRLFFKYKA